VTAIEKIVLSTSEASTPIAPYCQAIRVGSLVFVAGQVGIDPKTGKLVHGGIRVQTKQAIENLRAILATAGIGLDHVVKTTVFLKAAKDYKAMNDVYKEYFRDKPPARTTVQAIPPLKSILIELEAVACIP
jgi:2-iminobutanoate/2-iminopropanoate deaminase